MEHLLLQGGEQYLPFARSRIKTLRAVGLKHASQKFEIEGCLITVRIVGEHEYISLSGGSVSMVMDSGVVDIRNSAPMTAIVNPPGILYESKSVGDYNRVFAGGSDDGMRTHDGKSGQLSGAVRVAGSEFKGRVPFDALKARSFSPIAHPEDAEEESSSDSELRVKKEMAKVSPASCFTGRMRLYVQSMYGQYLYKYDDEKNSTGPQLCPDMPGGLSGNFPGLWIPAYNHPKKPGRAPALVNSSTGLHRDGRGRHWLMSVGLENVTVYPLKAPPAIESLRKHMRPSSGLLGSQDKEHLESYILSVSRPVVERAQSVPLGGEYQGSSMGYGWHWNWSGTQADIVINEQFSQGTTSQGEFFGMESTHFRLTMAGGGVMDTPAWSASVSVVEGKTKWAVNRTDWSIAHPEWASGLAAKPTPLHSELFDCNAPFYVFYRKDELAVCRVSVAKVLGQSTLEHTDGFDLGVSEYTVGLRGGYAESRLEVPYYWRAVFSCAGDSTGPLYLGRSSTGVRHESSNAVEVDVPYEEQYYAPLAGVNVETGYPPHIPKYYPPYPEAVPGVLSSHTGVNLKITMDYETSVIHETHRGSALAVIPFYDAEALFLKGVGWRERILTSRNKSRVESGSHGSSTYLYMSGSNPLNALEGQSRLGPLTKYTYGPAAGDKFLSSEAQDDTTETVEDSHVSVLIHTAGSAETTINPSDEYEYHEGKIEYASPQYRSLVSALGGTVIADFTDNINAPAATAGMIQPVIVGWA